MKKNLFSILFSLFALGVQAQPFAVSVNNGYGSGSFYPGDTVHVWAKEMNSDEIFLGWSGDSSLLFHPLEWTSIFIMPAQAVNLNAEMDTIGSPLFTEDHIQCVNSIKQVYYFFPSSPSGLIFLFHDNNAHAGSWIDSPENFQLAKDLAAANFAVVFTSAEEVTLNQDLNNDQALNWNTDSLSIASNTDIANIQALTDTFFFRGLLGSGVERYAAGTGNGGIFTGIVSQLLYFKSAVSYCADGELSSINNTQAHMNWCMANNDMEAGPTSIDTAYIMSDILVSHGLCSGVFRQEPTPVYPERFMRIPGTTLLNAQDIYNELQLKGFLDTLGQYYYLNIFPEDLFALVDANPGNYPVLSALPLNIRKAVREQMEVCIAGHNLFSDHNKRTIAFLLDPCGGTAEINDGNPLESKVKLFPNPACGVLNIQVNAAGIEFEILNAMGQVLLSSSAVSGISSIDISEFPSGIYFFRTGENAIKFIVE